MLTLSAGKEPRAKMSPNAKLKRWKVGHSHSLKTTIAVFDVGRRLNVLSAGYTFPFLFVSGLLSRCNWDFEQLVARLVGHRDKIILAYHFRFFGADAVSDEAFPVP